MEFENQELFDLLNGYMDGKLNAKTAKEVKKIEFPIDIAESMTDFNFSDLKYFTNLEEIILYNADIDLSDLQYNQSLKRVILAGCNVTNTHDLPNSIESFMFYGGNVKDDLLYLPYNLSFLELSSVGFTNIKPKNPEELTYFSLDGKCSKVDLSFLDNCPNLFRVIINSCPNVSNPEVLTRLPKQCKITLDDYAPIWLTKSIYSNIKNIDTGTNILQEIETLDKIANELVPDKNISEGEKVINISKYILNNLRYSREVLEAGNVEEQQIEENERLEEIVTALNNYPIKYALDLSDDYDEVCINYACLFQALANRVGVRSTQLMSKNHTWNLVDGNYLDLTSLDEGHFTIEGDDKEYTLEELLKKGEEIPEFVYYIGNFDDPLYKEIYHFHEQYYVDNNIGYVKSKDNFEVYDNRVLKISMNLLISIVFLVLMGKIAKVYDYVRYHKLEEDINKRIEEMAIHR